MRNSSIKGQQTYDLYSVLDWLIFAVVELIHRLNKLEMIIKMNIFSWDLNAV